MDQTTPIPSPPLAQTTMPSGSMGLWALWAWYIGTFVLVASITGYAISFVLFWKDTIALTPGLNTGTASLAFSMVVLRFAVFSSLALFLVWRRPRDPMVLIAATVFLSAGSLGFSNIVLTMPHDLFPAVSVWRFLAALNNALTLMGMMGLLLLFPTARFVPRWTGILLAFFCIVPCLHVFYFWSESAFPLSFLPILILVNFVILGFVVFRYKKSESYQEKQQIKWVGLGFGWSIILQGIIAPFFNPNVGQSGSLKTVLFHTVITLSYISVIAGFSLALTRYRLWDIDFAVNRSLVYGGLFAVVAGLSALGFWGMQLLLLRLLGHEQAVVSAALAMAVAAGAFQPTLRWLRRTVDQKVFGVAIDYHAFDEEAPEHPKQLDITDSKETILFADYARQKKLGVGGMGEVYLARQTSSDRQFAIKKLIAEGAKKDELALRFHREAEILSSLEHPNIVKVYHYGVEDGEYYIVMDYIDGVDLDEVLEEQDIFPLEALGPFLEDIAAALDYAHQQGVVHRDIKPHNVMLARAEESASTSDTETMLSAYQKAILMDFGIARGNDAQTRLTQDNKFLGTPQYIAPEQIQGAHSVDGRADLYAMGVMVFRLVTGRLPFEQEHLFSLMMAHLSQPPPDPRNYVNSIPAHAANAILMALSKRPSQRQQTVGAFVHALLHAEV